MSDSTSALSRAKIGTDAAALSLIDIRRIDRAATKSDKRGDLTSRLKKPLPADERSAAPRLVSEAAPIAAPVAAPITPPAAPPISRHQAPLPEPYVAPEPLPEPEAKAPRSPAPAIVRAAPLPYDDLRNSDDLIYYWDELRAGRELPFFTHLDRTRIAISWPDTVMVSYAVDQAAIPQIARLSRLTGAIEFSSLVTEWILSCSRQVAQLGKAMETRRAFTGTRSPHHYHMLLLPFADANGASSHVLCHLSCTD